MINVDFSGLRPVYAHEPPMKLFSFGHSDGDPTLPTIHSAPADPSLPYQSMASREMSHLLSLPGGVCRRTAGEEAAIYDEAIACSVPVRRLQVWSERQATMRLHAPGGGVHDLKFFDNEWTDRKRGYGTNVAAGFEYRLEMSSGDATIEFSDVFYGQQYAFPADEIDLVVAVDGQPDRRCEGVSSQHDRRWIDFEYGPSWTRGRGEVGACRAPAAAAVARAAEGGRQAVSRDAIAGSAGAPLFAAADRDAFLEAP